MAFSGDDLEHAPWCPLGGWAGSVTHASWPPPPLPAPRSNDDAGSEAPDARFQECVVLCMHCCSFPTTAHVQGHDMRRTCCAPLQGSKKTLQRASMPRLAQTTSCSGVQSFLDQKAPSGTEVGLRFDRGLVRLGEEEVHVLRHRRNLPMPYLKAAELSPVSLRSATPGPTRAGVFCLTMAFSEEYPNKAPVVRFKTAMFHPNSAWAWEGGCASGRRLCMPQPHCHRIRVQRMASLRPSVQYMRTEAYAWISCRISGVPSMTCPQC